jgi:hypothetical protein
MKYPGYLFMILIFLVSCRELVMDEFPEFTPVPTVNSILIKDSTIKVQVSLAGKIDTNQLVLINNAEVLLYVDGDYSETLTLFDNGMYSSSTVIEPLKTYRCDVNVPGYDLVSGSDLIPVPVVISGITHIDIAGKDEEGMTYPAVKFTFTNNPSVKQYYEVVIRLLRYRYESVASLQAITDPVLLNEGLPLALFSNESIKGSSYSMTINYFTGSASSINGSPMQTDLYPVILELRSVSQNYYRFVKQKYLYDLCRYPEFMAASTTAFPLYSNINGGYGIFAGYSLMKSDTIYPGN